MTTLARGMGALAALVLAACVTEPDADLPELGVDTPISVASRLGLTRVEVDLDSEQVVQGDNAFSVTLVPADDLATTELVSVNAFMPSHGHGTPVAPTIVEAGGIYRVESVNLFMPGRWDIELGIVVGGEADDLTFMVNVP